MFLNNRRNSVAQVHFAFQNIDAGKANHIKIARNGLVFDCRNVIPETVFFFSVDGMELWNLMGRGDTLSARCALDLWGACNQQRSSRVTWQFTPFSL